MSASDLRIRAAALPDLDAIIGIHDKLGRVYSYDALGSFVAVPLGQVLAGPVAGALGSTATLLGAAGVVLAATVAMLSSRSVRALPREAGLP